MIIKDKEIMKAKHATTLCVSERNPVNDLSRA